ncbi:UNVERIFIED_CONTAM: hypothetical protein K2H54_072883 [Gekko kuhli]
MAARTLPFLLLVGLLSIWAGMPTSTEAKVHPGKCPKPTGPGHCAEMCRKDSDCPADQKCCSNGCGRNCMKAIRVRPPRSLGQCPRPQGAGLCVEWCSKDSDCGAGQKCCSNGCGHECMKVTRGAP